MIWVLFVFVICSECAWNTKSKGTIARPILKFLLKISDNPHLQLGLVKMILRFFDPK